MNDESTEVFMDAPIRTQPDTQDSVSNGISETLTPTPHAPPSVTNNLIVSDTSLSRPSFIRQTVPSNPSSVPPYVSMAGPSVTKKGPQIAPMLVRGQKSRQFIVHRPRCSRSTLPDVFLDREAEFEAQGYADLGDRPWLMPGGPKFGTVLFSYSTHITRYIWNGASIEMTQKYVQAHTRPLDFLDLHAHIVPGPEGWWSIAHISGLTALAELEYEHVDHQLISAFVERWYPETTTSTFHEERLLSLSMLYYGFAD